MSYRVFVINPGSTSTKLAYFEDEKKLFETNVFCDAPELAKYASINDQLPYRKQVILDFIRDNGIDLNGIDAIVGRGGASYPVKGGVYEITDQLLQDTIDAKSGVRHPSNLGPQLARELQKIYGGRAFIVDSPMTDEFCELAHVSGLSGMRRGSHLHTLNLKATVRFHCKKNGLSYEDGNFIVCHIDGGMSVSAHRHGQMIDGNDAAGGEGPFTPTRAGGLDALDLIDYMIKELDCSERKNTICRGKVFSPEKNAPMSETRMLLEDMRKKCTAGGGFVSYFGTSNADSVHELLENGDEKALLVWNAMIYQICKQIGSMAVVLNGQVDGIVCGGGLLRFSDLREGIRQKCSWIAPVSFYPGEFEHEAMAAGAIRVLKGEEELQIYESDRPFPD